MLFNGKATGDRTANNHPNILPNKQKYTKKLIKQQLNTASAIIYLLSKLLSKVHRDQSPEQFHVVLFDVLFENISKTCLNFHDPFNSLDFCLTEGTSVFSTNISSHSQVGRLICYL